MKLRTAPETRDRENKLLQKQWDYPLGVTYNYPLGVTYSYIH